MTRASASLNIESVTTVSLQMHNTVSSIILVTAMDRDYPSTLYHTEILRSKVNYDI